MTTLQSLGARPILCLPKLKHYSFLTCLCLLFVLTTAFSVATHSFEDYAVGKEGKENCDMRQSSLMMQQIFQPSTSTTDTTVIADCEESISFASDSTALGLYVDIAARTSVQVICPQDTNLFLMVTFSQFDLEEGDTLGIYDGASIQSPLIGSGSGVGISNINGGWVASNCNKLINPSGCLTFAFQTDGDDRKGTGWESVITCEDGSISLAAPQNQFQTINCNELKQPVMVEAAALNSGCGLSNDTVLIQIFNARGTLCMDTCIRADSTFQIDTLAIGTYRIEHTLKAFTAATATHYISVSPPSITCNDEVEISLGVGCEAVIRPDNILENPCDTTDFLYYDIAIKTLDGQTIKSGTSRNGDFPVIQKDDIEICTGVKYRVEITRVYDYGNTCCSQGLIKDVCWSNVVFKDGVAPLFFGDNIDTVMTCEIDFDNILPALPRPVVIDNCDSVDVQFKNQELIIGDDCSDMRTYLVTWEASDKCGKTATRTDTLRVLRPSISEIIKLPDVILSCGEDMPETLEDYERLGIIRIPTPGDTIELSTEEYICNYILVRDDEEVPHPGGSKVTRFWAIVDGCADNPFPIRVDTQQIEFVDTIAPSIDCSPHTTVENARIIPLQSDECQTTVRLPIPTTNDICEAPTVEMFRVEQLRAGIWIEIASNLSEAGILDRDTFRVGWQAIDARIDNPLRDTCFEYFRIADLTPPQAICPDEVQVPFNTQDTRLFASEIQHRSADPCGIVKTEIRRVGGEWGEFIDILCTDVHTTIQAEIRVFDIEGNVNACGFNVIVVDFIPPFCADLADFEGTCDDFHNNQLGESTDIDGDLSFDESEWQPLTGDLLSFYNNQFGNPACEDNLACVPFASEQQYQVIYSQCGIASAQRRYRIIDWNGQGIVSEWNFQHINITYQPSWSITLPVDFFGECGDEVPDADISIVNGNCDVVAWEHEDQVFDQVPDACYKVIRTYHIINWCTYQDGQDPIEINRIENVLGLVDTARTFTYQDLSNHGYFTYIQVLKVTDNEGPTVSINNVSTCIYGADDAAPTGVEDITLGATPFECDTIRVFSAEASDCEKSAFKNFSFEYEIYEDGVLVGQGDGSKFFWVVQPKIVYTVSFIAYDNCGNSTRESKEFEFWDCRPPTVSCVSQINVNLSHSSGVRVDAASLDKGSFDNCSGATQLQYRVWHSSISALPPASKEEVAALPNFIELDCDYLGPQSVSLYVLDEENNFDFCVSRITVSDLEGICGTTNQSLIGGHIHTADGTMVEAVNIRVEGQGAMPDAQLTGVSGDYTFQLTTGQGYELIAEKNDKPLNGVSTFDLILMSKHILGITPFETPYQYIAADINKSGTITAFDLVQLRRLILNIEADFPSNQSWRFIDAQYEFTTDQPLLESFTEKITINNHSSNRMDADFIAIKIGDLNGSATTNTLLEGKSRATTGTKLIRLKDKHLQEGQVFTLEMNNTMFEEMDGYQFALAYEGLELLEIKEGLVKEEHIGQTYLERNLLLTSWYQIKENESTDDAERLHFTLVFRAEKAGKLSEFLQLQPNILPSEAYTLAGDIDDIRLQFESVGTTLTLEQNIPNPFRERTKIGFQLPKAGTTTLSIMDLQGRLLWQQQQTFEAGYNEWLIVSTDLPIKGILYYQLATETEVLTRKMMLIE